MSSFRLHYAPEPKSWPAPFQRSRPAFYMEPRQNLNTYDFMNDKRFLANILSNLPGMAYHCQIVQDWTMDFVSAGCVELTGYQTEEIIGNRITSFSELICAEDRQFVLDQIEQALYEHSQYDITYRIVAREDQEKWVREVGQGVDLQNGKYQALEGFITDISAQKQSELKLHQKMEHFRTAEN